MRYSNHCRTIAVLANEIWSFPRLVPGRRGLEEKDMKPTTRVARRGLAALARPARRSPSRAPPWPHPQARRSRPGRPAAVPPRCGTGALTAWLGIPGNGYAGGVVYQLALSNTSTHACTLYGYPGVSALAPGGHQLGHGHAVAPPRPTGW